MEEGERGARKKKERRKGGGEREDGVKGRYGGGDGEVLAALLGNPF